MSSDEDYSSGSESEVAPVEEDWDDWNEEELGEHEPTQSLFEDTRFPSPETCIEHDAKVHGFDLREYRRKVRPNGPSLGAAIRASRLPLCSCGR